MKMYRRPLNVSTPKGQRVIATITQTPGGANISLPFFEEVKRDKPPFAKNGIIKMSVPQGKYQQTIERLTSYLENLFLKGMSNDKDTSTSDKSETKLRRNKKFSSPADSKED